MLKMRALPYLTLSAYRSTGSTGSTAHVFFCIFSVVSYEFLLPAIDSPHSRTMKGNSLSLFDGRQWSTTFFIHLA